MGDHPPPQWLDRVAKVWATPVDQLGAALITLLLETWVDDEVGLMRYIWKNEPIASMAEDEVIVATATNLQHYVSGDLTAHG